MNMQCYQEELKLRSGFVQGLLHLHRSPESLLTEIVEQGRKMSQSMESLKGFLMHLYAEGKSEEADQAIPDFRAALAKIITVMLAAIHLAEKAGLKTKIAELRHLHLCFVELQIEEQEGFLRDINREVPWPEIPPYTDADFVDIEDLRRELES